MWALGCMIYELCALKPPFLGDSFPALKRAVTSGRFQPMPRKYSEPLHRIVASLIRLNPRERPSAEAVLRSPDIAGKLALDDGTTSFGGVPPSSRENLPNLMETIKVPQNLRKLNTALPKPCYPDVRPNSPSAWTMAEQKQSRMMVENVDQRRPALNSLASNNRLPSTSEEENYSVPSIKREVARAQEGLPSSSEVLPRAVAGGDKNKAPAGGGRDGALVKPVQAPAINRNNSNIVRQSSVSSAVEQAPPITGKDRGAKQLAYPKVGGANNNPSGAAVYSNNGNKNQPYVPHRMW